MESLPAPLQLWAAGQKKVEGGGGRGTACTREGTACIREGTACLGLKMSTLFMVFLVHIGSVVLCLNWNMFQVNTIVIWEIIKPNVLCLLKPELKYIWCGVHECTLKEDLQTHTNMIHA